MQSFAKAPQSAKHTSGPQRRQAATRSLLRAPQRLNRAACACGGTCPRCNGETRAAANLQPKLTVNQPGDAFEQEADRVADQVMRMADPNLPAGPLATAKPDSTQCLQRRAADPHGPTTAPPIVHEVLRAPGQPLDAPTREFMEPRFGRDFGNVQVHTDGKAAESARAVNARAYTVGNNVVFGAGQFMPTAHTGQRLLAHELAHVTQQSNNRTAVQRTIGDGHDLQSVRFAGDPVLEACFDDERLLRFGSSGPAVEKIQQAVVDAGFPLPVFGVDGIFRSETQGAVRDYQRAHGLDPDGIVGPITMGNLDSLFASPAPPAPAPPGPAPTPPGPAPAPPGPAPAPPGPAPAPPGPAPAPPGPAPAPPGPAPAPPGPAPAPPGPAPAPPGPAPAPPGPAPTPPVAVTIAGGSELWHFNGASPAGYPLAERLTAGAGGLAGTFRWSVVSGSSIAGFSLPGVPFPLPFAFDPAVSLVSLAPSVALNDVQVRVDFTGVAGGTGTATRQFTVRTPQSLTPTGVTSTPVLHTPPNAPTVRGWQSLVGYSIKDQFLTTLPRNVDVNEKWDDKPPINDVAGTNWAAPTEGNANVSPAGWNDKLRSPGDSIPPSVIPTPTAPGSGGPLVYHFRGHWQVGSPTTGSGKRVRSVTWRFFQDHGDHA